MLLFVHLDRVYALDIVIYPYSYRVICSQDIRFLRVRVRRVLVLVLAAKDYCTVQSGSRVDASVCHLDPVATVLYDGVSSYHQQQGLVANPTCQQFR